MLVDVGGLPGVADPDVADGAGGEVAALAHHVLGELSLLRLVLVLSICFESVISFFIFPLLYVFTTGKGLGDGIRGHT